MTNLKIQTWAQRTLGAVAFLGAAALLIPAMYVSTAYAAALIVTLTWAN